MFFVFSPKPFFKFAKEDDSSHPKCPKCGTDSYFRIPRATLVKLLPMLHLKRYRCLKCLNSFYVRVRSSSEPSQ